MLIFSCVNLGNLPIVPGLAGSLFSAMERKCGNAAFVVPGQCLDFIQGHALIAMCAGASLLRPKSYTLCAKLVGRNLGRLILPP